ncbi:orp1 like protein [Ceratocystis lukuohia]|uniref:Orp1 like protein n=1 Tax=Ceratocystis lukuohia TaxID=2019550 RepID=A0ABR4MEG7_9PEZI
MDLINLLNKQADTPAAAPANSATATATTETPNQTPSLDYGSKSPSPDHSKSRHTSETAPSSLSHSHALSAATGPGPALVSSLPPSRSMTSRAASRGRQPWSAGGYSLPLLPEGKEEVQVAPLSSRPPLYRGPSYEQSNEHGYSMSNGSDTFYRHHMNSSSRLSSASLATPREFDFPFNDPASKMRHHMSDSRSSMSSYVSSAFSHSRLSSASTVGHLASLTEDQLHLEKPLPSHLRNDHSQSQMPTLPRVSEMERRPSQYRTESMPIIPSMGYNQSHGPRRTSSDIETPALGSSQPESHRLAHGSSVSSTYLPATPVDPVRKQSQSQQRPDEEQHHGFGHSHKRSISMPDIPKDLGPVPNGHMPHPPQSSHGHAHAHSPSSSMTPPALPRAHSHARTHSQAHASAHSSRPRPLASASSSVPEFTGLSSLEFYPSFAIDSMYESKARCMYVDDCKTGSTLRKAISHIFGRNKLCTRLVPDSVWVHFCRKHYQRSRYRSAGDYSKLQIVLVQTQIQRVQRWSDDNLNSGRPGELTHWSLCIRKREAKRLEKAAGRKGNSSIPSSDDELEDQSCDANPKGTEVPHWLISHCGNKYNSEEILGIINRLQQDMENGKITQFPDIEILPSISYDGPAGQKRKTMSVSSSMAAPPYRRTQSMSFSSAPVNTMDGMPPPRLGPNEYYYGQDSDHMHSRGKRQRVSDVSAHNASRYLPNMRGPDGPQVNQHAASDVSGHHPHGRSQSDISQFVGSMPMRTQAHAESRLSISRQGSVPFGQENDGPRTSFAPSLTLDTARVTSQPLHQHHQQSPYSVLPPMFPANYGKNNGNDRACLPPSTPLSATTSEGNGFHSGHVRQSSSPNGPLIASASVGNLVTAAPVPRRPFVSSAIATLEEERRSLEAEAPVFSRPPAAVPVHAP